MHENPKHLPDRRQIGRAFSLKAAQYEEYALVQRRMVERLMSQLRSLGTLSTGTWLDLGCGTGIFAELAASLHQPPARLINIDLSPASLAMLAEKRLPCCRMLQADIVHPPLRPGAFDLVAMSSTLQWLDDQRQGLQTANELLKPRGHFAFAVFTAGTLRRLRALHVAYGLRSPVSFIEAETLTGLLAQTGFRLISLERAIEEDRFPSARDMLKSLSRIGSTMLAGRRLTRTDLLRLCQEYEDGSSSEQGVTAEYEIAVGVARKE